MPDVQCLMCTLQCAICIWHLTAFCTHPACYISLSWIWVGWKFRVTWPLNDNWQYLQVFSWTACRQSDLQPEAEVIWREFHSLTRINNACILPQHIVWGYAKQSYTRPMSKSWRLTGCSTHWPGLTMLTAWTYCLKRLCLICEQIMMSCKVSHWLTRIENTSTNHIIWSKAHITSTFG